MSHREIDRRSGTILVVDDVPAIRKMVCAMLAHDGYQCLEAGDGTEALRLLEGAEVLLVLTDVVMPKMDGTELARHISERRPELRILFMSGYTEYSVVRSIGAASSLFLAKPFTATMLMDTIRTALDRPWHGIPDGCLGVQSA